MQGNTTRRGFLKAAGLSAATLTLAGCGLTAQLSPRRPRRLSPNERLNVACIGVGGQGRAEVRACSEENLVAFCDVDDVRAAKTYNEFPDVPRWRDYRRMLEKLDRQIDAVTITTPDHSHFPIAMLAMQMGKHVFVQKPMGHTIAETRQMMAAARRCQVATQMGNQRHALEGIRLCKEWIDAGAIGPIREVQLWTDRPIWPQGIERPTEEVEVPPTLDWNRWLGTAPERPYHPAYAPFKWRGWWDFGCGALGDMGCHIFDAAFWALKLGMPTAVSAETSPVNAETAPTWSIVTYEFPARGALPPVKLVWYDGGKLPPRPPELEPDRSPPKEVGGQYIIGARGTIMADAYCESPRIIPEDKMQAFGRPPKTIPRSPGHHREWILACKGGQPAECSFEYAGPLTEVVLLGNLAIRTGKRIEWDAANLRCPNVPEANEYVQHGYGAF